MSQPEPSAKVIVLPQTARSPDVAREDGEPGPMAPVIQLAAYRRSSDTGPVPDLAA